MSTSLQSELSPTGYVFDRPDHGVAHQYLLPALDRILAGLDASARQVFDLGCGNGSVADYLTEREYVVTGVDPSTDAIHQINAAYPHLKLHRGSAYEPLAEKYGTFPIVISLEVVEHLFYPREYAQTLFALVEPGGTAIISTPYHGYFKNLALAVTGKMDSHFTALWECGHIKFWSFKTLEKLLSDVGFECEFRRVGRVPMFAKSMFAIARKPG